MTFHWEGEPSNNFKTLLRFLFSCVKHEIFEHIAKSLIFFHFFIIRGYIF